ncbi:MAG TPA: multicopper oxidase domain-containing protein [Anaerolineae bacterium]
MSNKQVSRRRFLASLGTVAAGVGLAACSTTPPATPTPMAGMDMQQGTPTADDMDAMHEAGVKKFLADAEKNSKTFWPAKMPFAMEGDTKVFQIACQEVQWDTGNGDKVAALSYNGVVPGQEIRVTEGDKVRFVVKNQMKESTGIHWHGVYTPNAMDGVPFITQPPIKPGATFTYEFTAKPAGSHMYHSHHNAAEQVTKGLLGAFVIDPKDKSKEPKFDSDYTMILNDANLGLTINGKGFPATAPIVAKVGEKVRVRFMNEGLMIHPMHLHGMGMLVFAQDGYTLPQPFTCDTLNIAPGQRFDVLIDCQEPGAWAFHCHILTHAESNHGMFGMVTALVINK